MNRSRGILIFMTVVLTVILALLPTASQAQCYPRTDWPTYIVVRGDTLARIARQYGISTADLANANCLINWNRIYYGQVLYVPPGGTFPNPTAAPIPTRTNIPATYQQFEYGFMVWRSDTGTIWVLAGDGTATPYSVVTYALLPENTFVGVAPAERFRPQFGFGRLWGNNRSVRNLLGWAVAGERRANLQHVSSPTNYLLLMGEDRELTIVSGIRRWQYGLQDGIYVPPIPPTVVPTTPPVVNPPSSYFTGSFQLFENGLMLWRGDNGDIWVLENNGLASRYPSSYYGSLPDSFNVGTTPPNRFRPILGFGRLWGNTATVRSRLGWATSPEMGATLMPQAGNVLLVALTAGRGQLSLNAAGGTWYYITNNQPPVTPQVLAFNANPNTVFPGQSVTLNWALQGVQSVGIEINNATISWPPEATLTDLPLSGTTSFAIPADYTGVWFTVYGQNYAPDGTIYRAVSSDIFVAVNTASTSTSIYAAYQPYDNGFMIWRSDTSDIYVFYSFGAVSLFPASFYSAYPENPVTVPTPPGRVRPVSGFGRVWGSQPYFMTQLGWATAPELGYSMLVENLSDGRTRFTLPSGNTVSFANGVWSG